MSATVAIAPALAELLERAGASDADKAAWHAERLKGATATQVRDIVKRGIGFRTNLLQMKARGEAEAWVSNQYTAWGNKREPIIAEWVRSRFGIDPESRVFHSAEDARWLASPDGLGADFDGGLLAAEIKTSKHDVAPWMPDFDRMGYMLQMQWVMRVTGARRCLYVWEQHDSDWRDRGGEFVEPAPLYSEPKFAWIEYDPAIVADLEKVAAEFLADLDAAREGRTPDVDEVLDTLAVNVLVGRTYEADGKKLKESSWAALQKALAKRPALSQVSGLARVTWTPGVDSTEDVPDVEAAKAADPDLFAQVQALSKRWNEHAKKFTKTVPKPGKPSLTVTSVKQKETK